MLCSQQSLTNKLLTLNDEEGWNTRRHVIFVFFIGVALNTALTFHFFQDIFHKGIVFDLY